MTKKVVTFGEIMMRLSPPRHLRFSQARSFDVIYGGSEANVAVSLANYNVPVDYVTRLPQNDIGDACARFLQENGLGVDKILWGGERLGLYFLEFGATARGGKVVYDRANSSLASVEPGMFDWKSIFADAHWFHWTGITPAISKGTAGACQEALNTARKMGLTISCDLNYRHTLWKWGKSAAAVMPDLVELSDIVIGNEDAVATIFGIHAPDAADTAGHHLICKELQSIFPNLTAIALTRRCSVSASHNTWSGVLWCRGAFYEGLFYDITHIVDRVGAGDAFAAGLIYGLLTHKDDLQKVLDFAVAASALKHTIFGDFNLVKIAEVQKLMDGDISGRVSR